jgi:ubiquinone/menaquinone biosynthesis C-methylase UbiE
VPSIAQNKYWWDKEKDWAAAGNEWSLPYGTPAMQWYASILPRIHSYVPAPTILEIAPGFGRCTHYLKDLCSQLVLVDLSVKCLDACKERFDSEKHITYHQTDGKSLSMVEDNSIDFMISFDSLVHVEMDVIQAYLEQLARKLKPNGVGFIHHSNLGSFLQHFEFADKLPRGRNLLSKLHAVEPGDHKRARSMTADIFVSLANAAGLKVVSQELVNWRTQRPIDCMSVFTRPGGAWDRDFKRWVNEDFDKEAAYIRKLADLYDRD